MPLQEKIEHVATFSDGMNTSTAKEYVPHTQAKRIVNCNINSSAAGDTMIVTNIKGNVLIENALPAGENFCLGTCLDPENLKFYFFIHNSTGLHSIYQYDHAARVVNLVMQSPILNFSKDHLILMTAITHGGNHLHWVDGGFNDARKLNIQKAIAGGYGGTILDEYINAYKRAPTAAPVAVYGTDTTRNTNMLYGTLMKFASRYVYDDGEKSNWSDYSIQPVPDLESFSGVNEIPSSNNFLDITITTGSLLVVAIEIAMQRTIDTGISAWELITTINKKKEGLVDNIQFTYRFYKDGRYPAIDQEKIIRPYSYLPAKPKCMVYARKAMIYGNFDEGWPTVEIDASTAVNYTSLVIENGGASQTNAPKLISFTGGDGWTDYVGSFDDVIDKSPKPLDTTQNSDFNQTPFRVKKFKVTVGSDVKRGNKFDLHFYNGKDDFTLSYTAISTDTATTVANKLKKLVIGTKRILSSIGDISANIYETLNDGTGNMYFQFVIWGSRNADYFKLDGSVQPVSYQVLNDTGQSLKNIKMGSTGKLGIVYEDFQGRKSAAYTSDELKYTIKSPRSTNGLASPTVFAFINHKPPIWARSYQIVRTRDLNYDNFIQMLAQNIIPVTDSGVGEYLDIMVGSLFTYQKMHPNTTLVYEFKKGDRIKFVQRADQTYYDDFETEVLSYKAETEVPVNSNLTVDGTSVVKVDVSLPEHVGKFILVNGVEREISESAEGTYTLSAAIGTPGEPETFLSYSLIDRRGLLRIRKPSINVTNNSLIEIYTPPAVGGEIGEKEFFFFGKKFDIINAGTENRMHEGNEENQTASNPALISVKEGTVYVRNRELPITNSFPGAQVQIMQVEDLSYSDFYSSAVNDNGMPTYEDTGLGQVHFGDRLRFSNVDIENTAVNGLNDFDNSDRKDYNDPYGDFKLLVYTENQILAFKYLKDCIIPVFQTVIQDNSGTNLLGLSSSLLNEIRYYGHTGGIGDHPESYVDAGTMKYHASAGEGVLVRLGGDGATPISSTYFVDNLVRDYLISAAKNKTRIMGGYDGENEKALFHFSGQGITLAFDEELKRFTTLQMQPEAMVSFMGGLFSFKAGKLWEDNKNPVCNNFYGVQYNSEITFYVNTAPGEEKTFSTIEVDSDHVWGIPETGDLLIAPAPKKPRGMKSRLKSGNFRFFKGAWVAGILRNMVDPRYPSELDALHNAEEMRGKVLEVRIVNTDTDRVRLVSVTVRMSK